MLRLKRRAGEHGRALRLLLRVRKLAEQVGDSIQSITEIVSGIQSDSESVKDSLENSYEQVQEGMGNIEHTSETFRKIDESIAQMVTDIRGITGELTTILSTSQNLSASVEEIASISEESLQELRKHPLQQEFLVLWKFQQIQLI